MDVFNAERIDSFLSGMSGANLKSQVRASLWMNVGLVTSQVLFLDFLVRSKEPVEIAGQLADIWAKRVLDKAKADLEHYQKAAEAPGQQGEMAKAILPRVEEAAKETEGAVAEIAFQIRKMGEDAEKMQEEQVQ